jgi:hypothetical protein
LPAGTHLILGGVVFGNHVAKIVGAHAVNIPRVEFVGGHAFRMQGNRGGGSNALMGMARSLARILFVALASVDAMIFLGTSEGPHS